MRLLAGIFLLMSCVGFGQEYRTEITFLDHPARVRFPKSIPGNALKKQIGDITLQAIGRGYLSFSVDSMAISDQGVCRLFVHSGPMYRWARIQLDDEARQLARKADVSEKMFAGKRISPEQLAAGMYRLLSTAGNKGYPFARTWLDSLSEQPSGISAMLRLEKGPFYRIDSLIIHTEGKINPRVVEALIGIKPGDPFNEKAIEKIDRQLRSTGFIRQTKPYSLEFSDTRGQLYLYLKAIKASYANGVIGVLPDAVTQKITVTGDVRISLKNSFGRGELLDLNWRRLQSQTQDFTAAGQYPYLLGTPLCPEGKLKIYKRDTTFLEVDGTIGFRIMLPGNNSLKAGYRTQQYTVLDQDRYTGTTTLPAMNDTRTNFYTLGLEFSSLDYRFNPTSGLLADLDIAAGNRRIVPNPLVDEVVYTGTDLKTGQILMQGTIRWFIPYLRRFTLMVGSQFGHREAKNLFENELFRVGGLRVLRGFDEESIRASSFVCGTLETRFILEENSYIFLFADQAWYQQKVSTGYLRDLPRSFGAGIAFQTPAGVFSISTALGHQLNNPIDLRSSKVHFGFVNFF
jgi:outer membrane protein assembly factor BamA